MPPIKYDSKIDGPVSGIDLAKPILVYKFKKYKNASSTAQLSSTSLRSLK
jgi:hypothetical protein